MRAVIQRVKHANITINGKEKRNIQQGLVVLVGIEEADQQEDLEWLAGKIIQLRIFDDETGRMNLSVQDIQGSLLIVSQFTLHASTKKGNRPSWIRAADPSKAEPFYDQFVSIIRERTGGTVETGEFGAHMDIEQVNNGPVTIYIDTKQKE